MDYFISFLAGAFFPLALGAYGGHLAASVLDGKKKAQALWIVWCLAAAGAAIAAAQQYNTYRSDKGHDETQKTLQDKLDTNGTQLATSLQRQEYTRGQLDSIGLMIGKVGEKSTDPVLGQLAGVIAKMADNTRPVLIAPPKPDARLQILYENAILNGRTISIPGSDPKAIRLSEFQVKNSGGGATATVSGRLYLSTTATSASIWQPTTSDDPRFPMVFFFGGAIPISPQETWNLPAFVAQSTTDIKEPVAARLKVFYGADRPVETDFVIRREK